MYEFLTSNNGSSSRVPEPLSSTTSDDGGGLPIALLAAMVGELACEGRVKAQAASSAHGESSASSARTSLAHGWVDIIATKYAMDDHTLRTGLKCKS